MEPRGLHIHASNKWLTDSIALYIYERIEGKIAFVSSITMTTMDDGMEIPEAMTIPQETAQELMDKLWQCGIRPSEGSGSAGSLKATQDHLKDMQELSRRLLSMIEQGRV